MDETLLPCPSCGRKPEGASRLFRLRTFRTFGVWFVKCPGCLFTATWGDEDEANAVQHWNDLPRKKDH